MINRKLREFVGGVINRGRINFGDVRRLERVFLPGGITNREELEALISLNAKLIRADKAWAQWLVAAVADFVATREGCGHPVQDVASQSVERLVAASATNLGRKIARLIRRELAKPRDVQFTSADNTHIEGVNSSEIPQPSRAGTPKNDPDDCSIRKNAGRADRIVALPSQKTFDVVTQSISQFPVWSALERYQIGHFSTGYGLGAMLVSPCMA